MIVKKVKFNPQKPKPKARRIGDLVDYICNPRDVNPLEKIEHSGSRGFLSATHEGQKKEMIGLAEESAHSPMPVSHWIFSWQEHEQPTVEQVDELVDIFLERMELSGHQAIYGLHFNTENYHVHIAVNRMSLETGKVVRPNNGFDIEAAHKVVAEIEHRQGWSREKNGRYTLDDSGRVVFAPRPANGPKPKAEALDFEARTGDKSAQRIAQERGHSIIKNAASWDELHGGLRRVGLRFEKKGSGAIIFVGDIVIKASSVDRMFSMGRLCKRLGEFMPGEYEYGKVEAIAPEPVSSAHVEDWKEYRAERNNAYQVNSSGPSQPTAVMEMKQRHKLERKRLARHCKGHTLAVINRARHGMAVQQREERRALASKPPRYGQRRQNFKSWLKAHGRNRQADRWRYRNRPLSSTPPSASVANQGEAQAAYAAHWEASRKRNTALARLAASMALFGKIPSRPPESTSRQDVRIALLMRAEGYDKATVMDAIRRNAPELRKEEKRDWRRYAARTVGYAFGVGGDMELAKMPLPSQISQEPRMEPKSMEAPPAPKPHEEEAWRERPRLRMR